MNPIYHLVQLIALSLLCSPASAVRAASLGAVDQSFNPGQGADGTVTTIHLAADGSIYLIGEFLHFDGEGRTNFARLKHDGALDRQFQPQSVGSLSGAPVTTQANGLALLGSPSKPLRLLPDGSIDESFHFNRFLYPRFDNAVNAVTMDPFGQVYVAGSFKNVIVGPGFPEPEKREQRLIARLNGDGIVDGFFKIPSWIVGEEVHALAVQPSDGRLLAGGYFKTNASSGNVLIGPSLIRFRADGQVDPSFQSALPVIGIVRHLELQHDGRVLFVRDPLPSAPFRHFGRLNSDGTLDESFDVQVIPDGSIYAVIVQGDGRVLIAGDFTTVNGLVRNRIARLLSSGQVDPAFDPGPGPNGPVTDLALDFDGKVLIGGTFTEVAGTPLNRVARLLADDNPPAPQLAQPILDGPVFLQFEAIRRKCYALEFRDSLETGTWQTLTEILGEHTTGTLLDRNPALGNRFYRLRVK